MNKATEYYRPGLLPGIIGAAACVAGLFVLEFDGYQIVRYLVSILALIIIVFAVQGRRWWWALPMVAVAVLWNPVLPFAFEGVLWAAGHIFAAAAFLAVGLFLRVPESGGKRK
ncbi:DUF6804 family protein [Amnibacterium flavum]|uniref:Uncharacterized protein n=1 Tax=Amnibacterium flavum TaxID=2173173 RepID=A0A2V1HSA8_9MICO|nr:DUF6804 family protein [Amnibacterium flavum]PVZ93197.1 hypothetical protein DDQ50_16880 [Amnibacterium flavum]